MTYHSGKFGSAPPPLQNCVNTPMLAIVIRMSKPTAKYIIVEKLNNYLQTYRPEQNRNIEVLNIIRNKDQNRNSGTCTH